MKKILAAGFILFSLAVKAQIITGEKIDSLTAYQTIYNSTTHETTLRGLLQRSNIEEDTTFAWFKKNYNLGTPDAGAVDAFKKHANEFQMIIFGGTWCEDTQNLLPQFFHLADAAGYPKNNITLIGVDRSKTTLDNLNKVFQITNVPTFIVMKNGKEVGRVVEYGKSGEAMKELGKIVTGL